MERRIAESVLLAALFAVTAAVAQNVDPTLPEDAADEQTMVPETAEADDELVPEEANDGVTAAERGATEAMLPADASAEAGGADTRTADETAPTVTTTPAAAPLRQAAAPAASGGATLNVVDGAQGITDTEMLRGGCWVRLYEGPNLSGNSLTLLGPADVAQPQGPFGMQWEGEVGSLEIGPAATVSLFGDENFEGTEMRFGAGRRVADLADELESLRIVCSAEG